MSSQAEPVTVATLGEKKRRGAKISVLTAYDYPFARLVDRSGVDITLVGDSLGRVELGYANELAVTMDVMVHHVLAVRRGTARALLLADMPFMSYQASPDDAVRNAGRLLQEGGANAVKLEGGQTMAPTVARLVSVGIPVCGHLGFTPQSFNQIGVRVHGKDEASAQRLRDDAHALQDAGAFAIVLELMPRKLAAEITASLTIPTIGIGAGPDCDGQVLVINDMLDLHGDERTPFKHVREYAHIGHDILRALRSYREEVEEGKFP